MIYNVSPHLLMDVRSCATRGWSRHIMGYTSVGDFIKMTAGSAYHAAMAAYLDPDLPEEGPARRARALAVLHAVYDDVWKRAPAEQLESAYTPRNIDRLFDRWMELHPPLACPWKRVLNVETSFVSRAWWVQHRDPQWRTKGGPAVYDFELIECAPFLLEGYDGSDDAVQLVLRPDALVEDEIGMIRYVDTKTTGWHITDPGWARALRMNLQTQLYADGVVQKYGDRATLGGWINACEIKVLPESDRKCKAHPGMTYAECGPEHAKTHIMPCLTTPENVAKAVDEAKRAIITYLKLAYQHRECAPRDRTTDEILSDLTNESWRSYPVQGIPNEGSSNDKCRFCPTSQWCDESPGIIASLPNFMAFNPWPVEVNKREHAV